nr:venom polypeptide precursor [Doratifera vulnerans]
MRVLFKLLLLNLYVIIGETVQFANPLITNVKRGGILLEGPHWSKEENALYFVDIPQQMVHRLDAESGNITSKQIGYGPVSLVVTVKNKPKKLLVSSRSELYFLSWDAPEGDYNSMRLLSVVDLGLPDNRCNDGKVDANGRLWFGTMGKEIDGVIDKDQGTLYMVDQYNFLEPVVKLRPVSISNGLAWTADNKYMFFIDTPTRNVDVMDFDIVTGSVRNRRTLFSFSDNNVSGNPDGMTIDTDGNLWIACHGGGKVIKVDPRAGKLIEQHKLPAAKVTSVTWGGHDLSTLYVTTSRVGLTAAELAEQPEAGSLFAIRGTGCKGQPSNQFVFDDDF